MNGIAAPMNTSELAMIAISPARGSNLQPRELKGLLTCSYGVFGRDSSLGSTLSKNLSPTRVRAKMMIPYRTNSYEAKSTNQTPCLLMKAPAMVASSVLVVSRIVDSSLKRGRSCPIWTEIRNSSTARGRLRKSST